MTDGHDTHGDAHTSWEQRYAESERIWSGRVNARLAEVADGLAPGRALDLGAGEGADAIWLARAGWRVVAVDISETALARGAEDAGALAERIEFQQHDLNTSFPDGEYDLVSAQFLHSHAPLEREQILRRAAAAVAPDGILLIVDHGEAPPWASTMAAHHHEFPSAQQVLDGLALGEGWRVLRCGPAERDAIGPDDKPAHLIDNVIVVQRVPRGCRWPAAAIGTTMTSANELAGRPRSNPRKVRTSQSRVIANGNPR